MTAMLFSLPEKVSYLGALRTDSRQKTDSFELLVKFIRFLLKNMLYTAVKKMVS